MDESKTNCYLSTAVIFIISLFFYVDYQSGSYSYETEKVKRTHYYPFADPPQSFIVTARTTYIVEYDNIREANEFSVNIEKKMECRIKTWKSGIIGINYRTSLVLD